MRKAFLALAAVATLASVATTAQAADYAIDPTHTFVTFEIDHFGTTTNRGRFVAKVAEGKTASIPKGILSEARETFDGLNLDALVCIGGDGSLSTALQLHKAGVPVVGVPKTIDNDLNATAMTFGFDSAVEVWWWTPSTGFTQQLGATSGLWW